MIATRGMKWTREGSSREEHEERFAQMSQNSLVCHCHCVGKGTVFTL